MSEYGSDYQLGLTWQQRRAREAHLMHTGSDDCLGGEADRQLAHEQVLNRDKRIRARREWLERQR